MKTNGAYTESISIGPEVMQICHINRAPISCFACPGIFRHESGRRARSDGSHFNWLMAMEPADTAEHHQ